MYNLRINLISLAATTEGQYVSKAVRRQENHKALPADTTINSTTLSVAENSSEQCSARSTRGYYFFSNTNGFACNPHCFRGNTATTSAGECTQPQEQDKKNNRQFCSF